jgi:hypothetical protein
MYLHFGVDQEYGAINYCSGEYDTAVYRTTIVGIPVYFRLCYCAHVVLAYSIREKERRERLRHFAQYYLGLADLPQRFSIPLRPFQGCGRLIVLHYLFYLGLVYTACAVPIFFGLLGRPLDDMGIFGRAVAGGFGFLLLPGLAFYLWCRSPSSRQRGIRSVVAQRLGVFSDPAGWESAAAERVAIDFGVLTFTSPTLKAGIDRQLLRSNYVDAMLLARLALAHDDGTLAERAEAVTDECLVALNLE